MSSENYINETLELPSEIPLFKYKVDFGGLKKLLQELNVKTNNNSESIKKINDQIKTKHPSQQFKSHEKILNNSIKFGINVLKYIDNDENKFMQINVNPKPQKTESQQFAYKISKLNQIVDFLLMKTSSNEERINNDDKKQQKLINDSFKRLQDKIQANLASFNKTINNYFNETNKKSASLDSQFHMLKLFQEQKLQDMQNQINNKITQSSLDATLKAYKHQIISQMEAQITNDQMKRMAAIEQFNTQINQFQKNMDLQNKVTKQKVNELQQKVKTALPNKMFEMEKHKIYEKLSEFKNKSDQLSRKHNEFVEFRKTYLSQKEKLKHEIIGMEQEIKKLNNKESSFKKIENVSDILQKFDPHLICQIGNEVKLHEKQIGKLEKKLMQFQNQNRDYKGNNTQIPQPSTGQNSEMMQKILKEYMANMDFEGRVRKIQKDLYETSKRTDSFHQLEKKIYNLSKDLDVASIMKELKRKCDEQSTRKELKVLDSKIQTLFDYFKMIRKELEIINKRTSITSLKDTPDNPSLTSKRLIGANCLSCTPNTKRRAFSRQKIQSSFDEDFDYLKRSNAYQRLK